MEILRYKSQTGHAKQYAEILGEKTNMPVSVSMEGKTLWQLQALPLDPWEILHTKEKRSVQLNVYPAVFFVLGFGGFFLAKIAPVWTVLCAYILLLLILWLVLHIWLKKKGTEIFASL